MKTQSRDPQNRSAPVVASAVLTCSAVSWAATAARSRRQRAARTAFEFHCWRASRISWARMQYGRGGRNGGSAQVHRRAVDDFICMWPSTRRRSPVYAPAVRLADTWRTTRLARLPSPRERRRLCCPASRPHERAGPLASYSSRYRFCIRSQLDQRSLKGNAGGPYRKRDTRRGATALDFDEA